MTTSLLRPEQRNEMIGERESLKVKLQNPLIEDKGTVVKQLRRLEHQLETQTPRPFASDEIDGAVKLEEKLRSEILVGMPSAEEMRKAPPGAVGKHMAWEKKNKPKILKWKETQLRLNADNNDPDVANFERYRPRISTLNMDNAAIPGAQYFMPPLTPAYAEGYDRVFAPKGHAPESPQGYVTASPPIEAAPAAAPAKRAMSAENRKKASDRMRAKHEAKRVQKDEQKE